MELGILVKWSLAALQATIADDAVTRLRGLPLSAVAGSREGQPASVPNSDLGAHTDPATGGTCALRGQIWLVHVSNLLQWAEANCVCGDVDILDMRVDAIESVIASPGRCSRLPRRHHQLCGYGRPRVSKR